MIRVVPRLVVLLSALGCVSPGEAQSVGVRLAAERGAAISGVVRDLHGTPQMGALVELLTLDARSVVTSFTDDHGRYLLPSVMPGKYQVRATAAFFMPTTRGELRLQPGARAVVNLTMSTLFESATWLPAQTRHADEPADDWKWTLRSTAGRPLLRLIDPEGGEEVSSSAAENRRVATSNVRVAVINGDGAFGDGGLHQVFSLTRSAEDADTAVFRADLGDPQAALPSRPSTEITAGYETPSGFGGRSTRLVTSYQSHPEITSGVNGGVTVLRLATAEQFSLGDAVLVDAGTLLQAERVVADRISAQPFVRVSVQPDDHTTITYRFAMGRSVQGSGDLDRLKPGLDVLADSAGRPLANGGHHSEIGISRKLGERTLTASVFAGELSTVGLSGSGTFQNPVADPLALLTDSNTGTFRLAVKGLSSQGVSLALAQPLSQALSATVEYDLGKALTPDGEPLILGAVRAQLRTRTASAVSVALRGKIARSGTALDAEYRWQPRGTLTQVNAFNSRPEDAFLSFFVRQRLWCGRFLPDGLDAVVEATNLLEQGYQPVLAPDGHTLFLAQVPRAIQGGLAFNF